jgi:glycosyltransferase involved in cell wall biosynthesis
LHGIEAWRDLPYWKRIALKHADRVIVTSNFSQEQVVRLHEIRSKRISRLPCTLDESLLRIAPAKKGRYTQLSDEQPVILTVARMDASEQYKGHEVVLRALSSVIGKVANLAYVIVGDGNDRPRLQSLARELGIAEHVIFTGEINDGELVALYQRSDIFVLPAQTVLDSPNPKGEGFGIVFLEAMAFGKPVVGPRYGAPAEIIRDGRNGLLVDPENPASVAEAISTLLADPGLARAMGQAGKRNTLEFYSYQVFREALNRILVSNARGATKPSADLGARCKGARVNITSNCRRKLEAPEPRMVWQILFLLWLAVVNLLYYCQFRALLVARLPHFSYPWR